MRIVLFVEGQTEARALPGFLKRWLQQNGIPSIDIVPAKMNGCDDYLNTAARAVSFHARQSDVIAVFGLLDIYRIPIGFPKDTLTIRRKVDFARSHTKLHSS
jgi:hypothetical protein